MDEQMREPAIVRFNTSIGDEQDPIERLRFFCSIAMNGQDWVDVEPLFDDLTAALSQPAAAEQAWIKWGGGELPAKAPQLVDIRTANGVVWYSQSPNDCDWRVLGSVGDIAEYRIAKAQGDSSHPAGGGGVQAPDMELVNLARCAIDKHWDFETLKYGDDLYGREHLVDAVWDFVEECQAIGRTAFDKKYPGAA